jgi:hypothetical protein
MKRFVVTAIKYLAVLSAVVFWLCPLRTGTQVLAFVGSIAVLLICHFGLSSIDEDYANKNAGDWPEPLDWTAPSSIRAARRPGEMTRLRKSQRPEGGFMLVSRVAYGKSI